MKRLLLAGASLLVATPIAAKGVAVSADPRATAAGQAILDKGGTAADAAMAMMLALTVVEPQSSGIGGGGLLVYYNAKTGKTSTIDGREAAPKAATASRFLGTDGKPLPFIQAWPGGKSVGVPGNVALMAMAHKNWGRLPWARLFDPAIALAGHYAVAPRMAGILAPTAPIMKDFPGAKALFWQDGRPKKTGEFVDNPALVRTFRTLQAKGAAGFYTGPIARNIVTTVRSAPRNPSDMTLADVAAYRAHERAPVCMNYRAYKLCTMGPPSGGGFTVLQTLGMLKRFDMAKLGKDSPVAWHLIGESMQLAYADRDKWAGDIAQVEVPVAGLLDPAYVRSRSALIREDASLPAYTAGNPPGAPKRVAALSGEIKGTTHFVAVDDAGNVASMTSTVESGFGSQLVSGGFVLNNELTDFSFQPTEPGGSPMANAVAGGRRPVSSMSPVIVFKGNKPVFAVGSAGGRRIPSHVLKTLIAYIDWRLPAEQAMAQPNLYFGGKQLLVEQGTSLAGLAGAMSAMGQTVTPSDLTSKLCAIEWTPAGWRGAIDPRIGSSLIE
ncbi:MAG TPA: gamma-glutamyltransferase [Sphingomonas sp.]|nr:gamma-glutamyltransferase [Sphingomonas sp.]